MKLNNKKSFEENSWFDMQEHYSDSYSSQDYNMQYSYWDRVLTII